MNIAGQVLWLGFVAYLVAVAYFTRRDDEGAPLALIGFLVFGLLWLVLLGLSP